MNAQSIRRLGIVALVSLRLTTTPVHALGADGLWRSLGPPEARASHAAVYDATHDRMFVVCGRTAASPAGLSEVWMLSLSGLPIWQPVATTGTPPPSRYGHTLVCDGAHDRLLLMGGFNGSTMKNDVWALSLSTFAWTQVIPAGSLPTARWGHVAAIDPDGDRMIVFGGQASGSLLLNDAWQLSLSGTPAWSALAPAGPLPSARRGASAIFDSSRRQLVLFGGLGSGFLGDAWSLSLAGAPAWSSMSPTGSAPSARAFHSATYDPAADRMVVVGGSTGSLTNDAWALSLSGGGAWSALAPSGGLPAARSNHSAVYDAPRGRLLLFGGAGASMLGDLWSLSLSGAPAWNALPASSLVPPVARGDGASALDPLRRRLIVFGGSNSTSKFNDVWVLPLDPGASWQAIVPAGTPPSPRMGARAVYDPVRDRLLVFGGVVTVNPGVNEVWSLSLSGTPTWTQLTPTGTPPSGRGWPAMVYDPVRDRLVLYGGLSLGWLGDAWELTLAGTPQWNALTPAGTAPTGRSHAAAIYDAMRDRMVFWGGEREPTQIPPFDSGSAWALQFGSSSSWNQLTAAGAPSDRYGMIAGYDAEGDRMLLFGGNGGSALDEAWEFALGGSGAWRALAPDGTTPRRRFNAAGVFDPALHAFIGTGGIDATGGTPVYLSDAFALYPAALLGAEPPALRHGLALSAPRPNPVRAGGVTLDYSLPTGSRVTLRLFDLSGRRVATLFDGLATAGRHEAVWNARDASGAAAAAGIYFCELSARGERRTQRIVLMR